MRILGIHTASRPADGDDVMEDLAFQVGSLPVIAVIDGRGANTAAALARDAFEHVASDVHARIEAARADASSSVRLQVGRALEAALLEAHSRIRDAAQDHAILDATGAALAVAGRHAAIAHVGDVRAYLLRDGRLRRLTDDHTVAMARVRAGTLTPDQAAKSDLRLKVTQALGSSPHLDVDVAEVSLADGDLLVLCSDGVHAAVSHARVGRALDVPEDTALPEIAERLLALGDGDDGASVAVVRIATDADADVLADLTEVMSQSFLFRDLSDRQRALIAPYMEHRFLDPGDILFLEGERGDTFYVVVDGTLVIRRGDMELTEIESGGHFGELTLARPAPRSATVEARTAALVLGLSRDRFRQVVQRRPAIGASIAIAALDHLGHRVRDLTERLA